MLWGHNAHLEPRGCVHSKPPFYGNLDLFRYLDGQEMWLANKHDDVCAEDTGISMALSAKNSKADPGGGGGGAQIIFTNIKSYLQLIFTTYGTDNTIYGCEIIVNTIWAPLWIRL